MSAGDMYLLPPLVRLIYATGCGSSPLLPTPVASDFDRGNDGKNRQGSNSLGHLARHGLLPTPTQDAAVVRSTRYAQGGLPLTMALIPTPTASDAAGAGSRNTATSKAHPGVSLTDWARGDGGRGRLLPSPGASDSKNAADYSDCSRGHSPQLRHLGNGLLNPRFVESMMRLPSGWTELP